MQPLPHESQSPELVLHIPSYRTLSRTSICQLHIQEDEKHVCIGGMRGVEPQGTPAIPYDVGPPSFLSVAQCSLERKNTQDPVCSSFTYGLFRSLQKTSSEGEGELGADTPPHYIPLRCNLRPHMEVVGGLQNFLQLNQQ